MHDRLVVGYDGSEASLAALGWAINEAQTRGASVRAISSYSMPPLMDVYGVGLATATAGDLEQLERSCEASLRAAVEEAMRRHPEVGFDFYAVDQPPAQRLILEAAHADLLVVGSNGMGAAKSFLLGSVLADVLHESPCPVAVVPFPLRSTVGTVVVGVDDSECSTAALRWAADEADRHRAELRIIHAWEYPYGLTAEGVGRGSAFAQVDGGIVLDRAVEFARGRVSGVVSGQLVEGGAAQTLLDASDEADLIVVGSRGRGGFRSMLLGSVAHAVSAHATCPVIVVRSG